MKVASTLMVGACLAASCSSAPVVEADAGDVHAVAKRIEATRANFRVFKGHIIVGVGNRSRTTQGIGRVEVTIQPEGIGGSPSVVHANGNGEQLQTGQELELKLPVEWTWPTDSAEYLKLLKGESVAVALSGWAEVGGERIPVQGALRAPLPVLPEVRVRHVEATREGDLSKAELTFEIEVKNEHPFAVKIKKVIEKLKKQS